MLRPAFAKALATVAICISTFVLLPHKQTQAQEKGKKIVFVAGTRSHGYGSHEHYAGCRLLADAIQQNMKGYEVDVIRNGWPKDESVFDGADCVVMYAMVAVGILSFPTWPR